MSTSRAGSAFSFLGFGSKAAPTAGNRQTSAAAGNSPQANPSRSNSAASDGSPQQIPYRKGAGVYVPPGTSNGPLVIGEQNPPVGDNGPRPLPQGPQTPAPEPRPAEIPVKAHMRSVPAVEKSLLPAEVTLELLTDEARRIQRITTQRVVLWGLLAEEWIRKQAGRPLEDRLDRANAIKKIRMHFAAEKIEKKEIRVDLFVRCYWVAVLLGDWRPDSQQSRAATNELSYTALRLFPILIERDPKSDAWSLVAKYAEQAKALWERAVKEHLSAAAIDNELCKIVPARTLPIKKRRPVKIGFVLRLVPRLPIADVPTLIARLQEMQRQSLLGQEAKAG